MACPQGDALGLGLNGDTLNGGAATDAAAAAIAVAAEGGGTPGPGPGLGDGTEAGWVPPSGICRRTRAHVSLRDVEWDVLEQQLPEHVDMEELELAEDDEEYGRFLQVGGVLYGTLCSTPYVMNRGTSTAGCSTWHSMGAILSTPPSCWAAYRASELITCLPFNDRPSSTTPACCRMTPPTPPTPTS